MAAGSRNPLDVYRRRAVFDVAEMAVLLEGEDVVTTRSTVWNTLAEDPLFVVPDRELTLDESRELAFKWQKRIAEYDFLLVREAASARNPTKSLGALQAVVMLDCNILRFAAVSQCCHYYCMRDEQ